MKDDIGNDRPERLHLEFWVKISDRADCRSASIRFTDLGLHKVTISLCSLPFNFVIDLLEDRMLLRDWLSHSETFKLCRFNGFAP